MQGSEKSFEEKSFGDEIMRIKKCENESLKKMSPARERRAKKKSCEEKNMKSQIRKTKVKKKCHPPESAV